MNQKQFRMTTILGSIFLVASPRGLQGLYWEAQPVPVIDSLDSTDPCIAVLKQAVEELNEYFAGSRHSFDIPLDYTGTEFQRKVWDKVSRIPYGTTCSYGRLATQLQNPKAVRAVGTANGKNPLCIVVPCHRVIQADGSLGGYSGGLENKRKLLELENVQAPLFTT